MGGAEALHKISSRISKGNIAVMGREIPIEVFAKAPDKRMSVTHSASGDSITAFDGQGGWLGNTGRPARDMSGQEAAAARLDADFCSEPAAATIFERARNGQAAGPVEHTQFASYMMLFFGRLDAEKGWTKQLLSLIHI